MKIRFLVLKSKSLFFFINVMLLAANKFGILANFNKTLLLYRLFDGSSKTAWKLQTAVLQLHVGATVGFL